MPMPIRSSRRSASHSSLRVQEHELQLAGEPPGGARSRENELMAGAVAGYGRPVGIYTAMVRRARLRAVAPGMGLAPAR
jgi:hypothetical protein